MKFEGTQSYVATDDLKLAVNAAITLQRPLLVKGEPGTGKTMLAEQLAEAFGAKLITWHIKSTTKAHQGLYEYDAVSRLRDSQLGDPRVSEIGHYIRRGKLWEAFAAEARPVLSDANSVRSAFSAPSMRFSSAPRSISSSDICMFSSPGLCLSRVQQW